MEKNDPEAINDPNEVGIYSYYDKKSEYYDIPWFSKNVVQAKRKFYLDTIANDGKSVIANFTSDFTLLKIGTMNLKTGIIRSLSELVIEGEKMNDGKEKK